MIERDEQDILGVGAVAAALGVQPATVRRAIAIGQLQAVRVLRQWVVRRSWLDASVLAERARARAGNRQPVASKVCPKCGVDKAASEYYSNPAAPHGLSYACKACRREEQARARAAKK